MPKVTKVSQQQMDGCLTAILAYNLSEDNAEFAKMLIHGNAWMVGQLSLGS